MKKHLSCSFMALAILFVYAGCTKSGGGSSALSYSVTGLYDVTVRQNVDTSFTMAAAVAYTSGTKETVTLTPTNLPAGVTVSPASASGTGTFASSFTYNVKAGTTGTFPVDIVSSSSSTANKTSSFNLIVTSGSGPGGGTGAMTYTVNNLSNITLPQYADTTINLAITTTLVSGAQETVTLTPISLPTGVTFTPTSEAGIPTFSTVFAMHVAINTPGTYPVTIQSSSASTATKTFTFNIIVSAPTACAPTVAGTYTATDVCSPVAGGGTYPCVVSTTAITNQVSIPVYYIGFKADLNCSAGTIATEAATYGDFDIMAGSGTFTANKIVVTYTLYNGINTTCTTTLTR